MRIRNKAGTWYRGHGVTVAPGVVFEVDDHTGREMLVEIPWHFEQLPDIESGGRQREESAGASPGEARVTNRESPPPASPMAHEPEPAPAEPDPSVVAPPFVELDAPRRRGKRSR